MKYLVLLTLIISCGACQKVKYPEKPKNLVDKEKMVEVLTEAYLTNAARSIANKTVVSEGIKMDSSFYARFGVDSLQFARSNDYYAADVNNYISIFQEVEERLGKIEKKLDSIRKAEMPERKNTPTNNESGETKPNSSENRLPNRVNFY